MWIKFLCATPKRCRSCPLCAKSGHSDDHWILLLVRPLGGVSNTHSVRPATVYRISTWTFHGEHFYIWLLGWPAYRQQLAMLGRKPIRPGRFVSSLAPFRAVLPTSLPACLRNRSVSGLANPSSSRIAVAPVAIS